MSSQLVPKLRFPEFRDRSEWDLQTLSSASDVNPKNDGLPDRFIYIDLESVKKSVLIERKEISQDVAPSRAQRLLSRKDIIYQTVRPYQRNNFFFDISDENEYVASTGYAQLRARECPEFLYQLLHTDSFVNNVLARCSGSNYPAIKPSDLASIEVVLPQITEQQKIADCLGSLDCLIAAEGQKLEALRQHKQGLMQQLFPQSGETVPRLRFPEFRDAGKWERNKLGCIGEFVGGGTPNTSVPEYWGGDIQWFTPTEIKDSKPPKSYRTITSEGLNNSSAKLLPTGALLITTRATIGDVGIADCPCATNQGFQSLVVADSEVNTFWYYWLIQHRNELTDRASGSTFLEIGKTELKQIFALRPDKEEQRKIADCLGSLDDLIAAQSRKLEALQQHKKGLMQQLFPSLESH